MYTDSWERLCFPDAQWRVVPEWRQLLFDDAGLRWQEWRALGKLHLVKDAPHRQIFRVELSQHGLSRHMIDPNVGLTGKKTVYIKLYPLAGFRRLAEAVGFSNKAQEECEKLLSLLRQGIRTLEPIAYGRDPRHAYVVTAGLENMAPLDRWLVETFPKLGCCEQLRLRFLLPDLVARIIAELHRAGAYHADLHAGNLLIRYHPGEEPKIYVTDAWEIRLGAALCWRRSYRNLVLFGRWFLERTCAVDRRRFLRAYIRYRSDLQITPTQEQQIARQLERSMWRSLLRYYRRREQRPWSQNRYFYRWSSSNGSNATQAELHWRAWAVRDIPVTALQQIADEAAALLSARQPSERPVSNNSTSAPGSGTLVLSITRRELSSKYESEFLSLLTNLSHWQDRGRRGGFWETNLWVGDRRVAVIVKCFRLNSWRSRWAERWHFGPASRSWHYGYALSQRDIFTPRPLVLLHGYRQFLPLWALLVCEKELDVLDLRQAFAQLQENPARRLLHRHWELIRAVAKLVARLHRHGFSHRDLKAAHFLVKRSWVENGGQEPKLYLLDLVGLSRPLILTRYRHIRDLARLQASFHNEPGITRTDRLRFLRAYLPGGLRNKRNWKHWWCKIAATAQRKVLRNHQQNRPLT